MRDRDEMVEGFKELITTTTDVEDLRKALTSLYMSYSRYVIRNAEDLPGRGADIELFYLSLIIEVLDRPQPIKN